mmetsp:Transcript_4719/g.11470  ORF Transcript_4719/g.11470 Transcript_4719/m.11470 type:complete len:507 (-) Transcript_4719:245-1765(-)
MDACLSRDHREGDVRRRTWFGNREILSLYSHTTNSQQNLPACGWRCYIRKARDVRETRLRAASSAGSTSAAGQTTEAERHGRGVVLLGKGEPLAGLSLLVPTAPRRPSARPRLAAQIRAGALHRGLRASPAQQGLGQAPARSMRRARRGAEPRRAASRRSAGGRPPAGRRRLRGRGRRRGRRRRAAGHGVAPRGRRPRPGREAAVGGASGRPVGEGHGRRARRQPLLRPPRAVAAGERRAGVPRDSLPPGAGRGGGAARGAVGRARPPDAADVARVGRRRRLGRAPGIAVALVQALGRSAVVARPPASTAGDRSEQRWRGAPDHRAAARGAPIGGGGGRRLGRRAAARPRPRRRCPGRASARAPGAPPPRRRLHGVPPRAPDGGGGQPRHHGGGRAGSFSSRGGSSGAGGENGASGGAQCVAHCAGGGVDAALRGLRGREAGGAARAAQLLRGVRRCLCRRRVVRLLAPRLHCGGRPPLMGCPRCPRNGFAADLWRRRCHGLSPSR